MKVLHVSQNYFPSIGGTQYTMQQVSEHLQNIYGDAVTVYTTNSYYGPNNKKFKRIPGRQAMVNDVPVHRFGFLRAHKPLLGFAAKASLKAGIKHLPVLWSNLSMGPVSISMKQAICSTHADVICASSVHYNFADYGIHRRRISNPRPFVLYGALHLETNIMPAQYLNRIKAADHYIANTTYEKDFLISKNIHPDTITVAGAGTDVFNKITGAADPVQQKKELGIDPGKQVILCISRHEAFKGLPVLLEAFKQIQSGSNACLIIAGASGSYSDQLQQACKQISDLYVFTNMNEQTKLNLLQMTDIVVLPSKEESFGVVFLEAWSCQKPVIGTRIGAIASLVQEAEDGYLFAPGDIQELVNKINKLLANKNVQKKMGQAGYDKVQRYYTWDKITAAFRSAYLRAMADFKS